MEYNIIAARKNGRTAPAQKNKRYIMIFKKFIGDRAFYRRLFAVMTPILIQNVITNFVSLLDNVMVGQVGTEPMSGVAIVNQLMFVFNLCIFGGLAGAGIFTAQFYGKGDNDGIRETFRVKLYIALASMAVFMALFISSGKTLISLFLHEGEEALDLEATLGFGLDYMRVMFFGMLPFAVTQVYSSTLRETGETMLPMKAGIVAVFVNFVFNFILIFGVEPIGIPALGVVGASVATVIARFTECAIVIVWTHRHKDRNPYIVGVYRTPRVAGSLLGQIAIIGAPLLLNELLWASGMTMLNQCYSVRGLEVVSALNISTTVSDLFFCAFFAMGTTVSIMVGQLLGAGETERAVDENIKLIAFSVALSACVGAVMAALSPFIPLMYNTTDAVRSLASRLLTVSAVMMPLNAFVNASYFTLRSGGKTVITFIFDSGFVWTLCVPLAFVLSRFTSLPVVPMFIFVEGLNLIKAAFGFYLVKSRRWVNNLVDRG